MTDQHTVHQIVGFLSFTVASMIMFLFIVFAQYEDIREVDAEKFVKLEDDINFLEQELKLQKEAADISLIDLIHRTEMLEAQSESIHMSVNGQDIRKVKRNTIIAAIKQTLPRNGNFLDGCPRVPSPGEIWSIADAIVTNAEEYNVSTALITAIIRRESAFCNRAVSIVGAKGYMQLMPATAAEVSADVAIKTRRVLKTWKGKDNIQLGTAYISNMLLEFDGNALLAARAYNAGPNHVKKVLAGLVEEQVCKDGTVTKYHCETEHYGTYVMQYMKEYESLGL